MTDGLGTLAGGGCWCGANVSLTTQGIDAVPEPRTRLVCDGRDDVSAMRKGDNMFLTDLRFFALWRHSEGLGGGACSGGGGPLGEPP